MRKTEGVGYTWGMWKLLHTLWDVSRGSTFRRNSINPQVYRVPIHDLEFAFCEVLLDTFGPCEDSKTQSMQLLQAWEGKLHAAIARI